MSKKDNHIMAENIKNYLEQTGKRAIDISDALDIPQSTVSNWMNEIAYPRMDKINLLAEFFHCDPIDLIRDHDLHVSLNEDDAIYAIIDGTDSRFNKYVVKLSELDGEAREKVYSYIDFISSTS